MRDYDDVEGQLADALRNLISGIMDEQGGPDLLPVDPSWDPEHFALIEAGRKALAEYDTFDLSETKP